MCVVGIVTGHLMCEVFSRAAVLVTLGMKEWVAVYSRSPGLLRCLDSSSGNKSHVSQGFKSLMCILMKYITAFLC